MADISARVLKYSDWISRYNDLIVAVGVVCALALMVIPMPPFIMDFCLSVNFALSIAVLMGILYVREPLEFSVFPSILLFATLYRLSLNVSTTRLILGEGYAGKMIEAFGNFVAGDNQIVGFIIFLIFIIIQFVVITKGATRISEVAARFTLDAMPGKQMSIDADLNAGLITEEEARKRRQRIIEEANFYGAMDGASKFVRGDAIAGVIITIINILGGFIIGVLMKGMSWAEAAKRYTTLTIGDGLVSQVPALILSVAAGLIVTRSSGDRHFGSAVVSQIFAKPGPRALLVTGGILFFLAFTPLPKLPLIMLSCGFGGIAYTLYKAHEEAKLREARRKMAEQTKAKKDATSDIESALKVDPLSIELGYGLIPLIDTSQGGELLDRITNLRRECAAEIGIIVPPIRIRDSIQLPHEEYVIKLYGNQVGKGKIYPDRLMAFEGGMTTGTIEGINERDPTFNIPVVWIEHSRREEAIALGYTVIEPAAVITTHLTDIVKKYAAELLRREELQKLLDELKKTNPSLVEEVIEKEPPIVPKSLLHQILKNLLRESVPIRNLGIILETLADILPMMKEADIEMLTEYVRMALARDICFKYAQDNKLYVITMDSKLEETIFQSLKKTPEGTLIIGLSIGQITKIISAIEKETEKLVTEGYTPVLLVSPQIRAAVKKITEKDLSSLVVLSHNEVLKVPEIEVETFGMVSI